MDWNKPVVDKPTLQLTLVSKVGYSKLKQYRKTNND